LAVTEGPIRAIHIDHVDHDVVGPDGQFRLQLVGDETEESELGLLVVAVYEEIIATYRENGLIP
jgi:hypothetical protein